MEAYDSGIQIVDTENGSKRIPIKLFDVQTVSAKAGGRTPSELEKDIIAALDDVNLRGRLLVAKASGTLKSGNPSDVNFAMIRDAALARGAFSVKKDFAAVSSKDYKETEDTLSLSIETIEQNVMGEFCVSNTFPDEKEMARNIMYALNDEKQEGETVHSYDERIRENMLRVLGL